MAHTQSFRKPTTNHYSDIELSFPKSSSKNFSQVLAICRKYPYFRSENKKGITQYKVRIPVEDIETVVSLWELVKNWKGSQLSANGRSLTKRNLTSKGLGCYRHKQQQSASFEQYCYGKGWDLNVWGCTKLGMSLATIGNWCYGQLNDEGVWFFDKETIKRILDKFIKGSDLELCPIFNSERVYEGLSRLPESIDFNKNKNWTLFEPISRWSPPAPDRLTAFDVIHPEPVIEESATINDLDKFLTSSANDQKDSVRLPSDFGDKKMISNEETQIIETEFLDSTNINTESWESLAISLNDDDEETVDKAKEKLFEIFQNGNSEIELLTKALKMSDEAILETTLDYLVENNEKKRPELQKLLLQQLASDSSTTLREKTVFALTPFRQEPDVYEALRTNLWDEDCDIRMTSAMVLLRQPIKNPTALAKEFIKCFTDGSFGDFSDYAGAACLPERLMQIHINSRIFSFFVSLKNEGLLLDLCDIFIDSLNGDLNASLFLTMAHVVEPIGEKDKFLDLWEQLNTYPSHIAGLHSNFVEMASCCTCDDKSCRDYVKKLLEGFGIEYDDFEYENDDFDDNASQTEGNNPNIEFDNFHKEHDAYKKLKLLHPDESQDIIEYISNKSEDEICNNPLEAAATIVLLLNQGTEKSAKKADKIFQYFMETPTQQSPMDHIGKAISSLRWALFLRTICNTDIKNQKPLKELLWKGFDYIPEASLYFSIPLFSLSDNHFFDQVLDHLVTGNTNRLEEEIILEKLTEWIPTPHAIKRIKTLKSTERTLNKCLEKMAEIIDGKYYSTPEDSNNGTVKSTDSPTLETPTTTHKSNNNLVIKIVVAFVFMAVMYLVFNYYYGR